MNRWFRTGKRLIAAAILILVIDGCLYRDPYVALPGGYGIGGISPGSPCSLVYNREQDERLYSNWSAHPFSIRGESPPSAENHYLIEKTTGDLLRFDSWTEWDQARREENAAPEPGSILLHGIERFNTHDLITFGECDSGYFLLNIPDNSVRLMPSRPEWTERVTSLTGSPPGVMLNPKSRLLQNRDSNYYLAMSILMILTLPWVLSPLQLFLNRRAE